MSILKEKRYLGMIGAALTIIGVFLPFISVSVSFLGVSNSQSVSWITGDTFSAVSVVILSVIALLMMFSDKLEQKISFFGKFSNQKLTLIPTVISVILLIYTIIQLSSAAGLVGSLANVSYGIGFWLIIIGLVACVAYPFIYKGENK